MATQTSPAVSAAAARRPGSRSLSAGIIALPAGVALLVVVLVAAAAIPALHNAPAVVLLLVLFAVAGMVGGAMALVVGLVRRLMTRPTA